MDNKLFIYILLFLFSSHEIIGQDYQFDHITTENGLSNNSILDIYQDSSGFIWIGTEDGINRFDGYSFRVYQYNLEDSTSIDNNAVSSICKTTGDDFYAGTLSGLNFYDSKLETFKRIPFIRDEKKITPKVYKIVKTAENKYLAATSEGLFCNGLKGDCFYQFQSKGLSEHVARTHISSLYIDKEGLIWIGTHNDGVYFFDPGKQKTLELSHYSDNENTLRDNKIISICGDSNNTVWFATNKGVYRFFKDSFIIEKFSKSDASPEKGTADKSALNIFENTESEMWVLTRNGLSIYNKKTKRFTHVFNDPYDINSLNNNVLNVGIKDRQGNIWIGTSQSGINILKHHPLEFSKILSRTFGSKLAHNDFILSVLEDYDEKIWLGTYGNGINIIDNKKAQYSNINSANTPALKSDHIQCLMQDSKKRIWIGTYLGGLTIYDQSSNTYTPFLHAEGDSSSLPNDIVNHIFEDSKNRIWIATHKGFSRYIQEKGNFKNYFSYTNENVFIDFSFANQITEDSEGNLWISTFYGLFMYNPDTELYVSYKHSASMQSLSSNTLSTVYCDKLDRVWVGTFNGLNLFDRKTKSFLHYFKSDGLPENSILSIIDDQHGNLWLATNSGLSKFDPEQRIFTNLSKKDGLVHDIFNLNSVFKNKSGKLYFGSKYGVAFFNPRDIKFEETDDAFNLHFTSLRIFNEYIKTGEKSILKMPIDNTKEIILNHQQSFVTLDYTTLNFINPYSDNFSYFLEGYDYGWIDNKDSHSLTYTRIPSGKYTLHVKATNNLSKATSVKSIGIIVKPPIWASKVSYLLYLMVLVMVGYVIYSYLHSRSVYEQKLLIERYENEKNNEINQSKIKFFINAAHEFKTPLTLILSPLERLLNKNEKIDGETRTNLTRLVYRNAQVLSRLINQIMDLRRIDTGNVFLKAQEIEIVSFLKEVSTYFDDYAINHSIAFVFNSDCQSIMAWVDTEKAEKIFLNLLSNAFKHAPDGSSIELNISTAGTEDSSISDSKEKMDFVSISVVDSGAGIAAIYLEKIFDRFYQIEDNSIANPSSSGIGLSIVKEYVELHSGIVTVKSQPGQGSEFRVLLPLGDAHLKVEEKSSSVSYKLTQDYKLLDPVAISRPAADINYKKDSTKILVVEDNYELRNYIVESFNIDFDVYEASDGADGLKTALDVLPELIVSDVMMPKMNGYELCKAIKSDVRISHIPVILLSVLDSNANIIEGFDEGADDYLNKPFDINVLSSRIKNLIANRNILKQKYMSGPDLEISTIAHNRTDQNFVKKAFDILTKNLSVVEFTAEIFSREMGMSRSNLHLKMRALTNQSTTEFIRSYRLKEAAKLLSSNNYNISEVAYLVGFNNISYFNRCFKKMFNVTPSQYLDNLK